MLYKNIKTGSVIDVNCELAGNWKKVENAKNKTEVTEKKEEPKDTKKKAKKSGK